MWLAVFVIHCKSSSLGCVFALIENVFCGAHKMSRGAKSGGLAGQVHGPK